MAITFFQTLQSFSQFLLNYTLTGGGLVEQNVANIRAATCASCHNNRPSGDIRKICSSCNKMASSIVNKFRSAIIKDNKTTSDARLLACGLCGCDLKMKVWIPNKFLGEEENINAWPTFCWRKKAAEGQDV